jgi:hypothetical protein
MEINEGHALRLGRSLYLTMPWLIPLSRYGAGGQHYLPHFSFSRSRQNDQTVIATRARPNRRWSSTMLYSLHSPPIQRYQYPFKSPPMDLLL